MMGWLRRLIHRWVGNDRYHEQASQVTARNLRAELLDRKMLDLRMDVRSRGR